MKSQIKIFEGNQEQGIFSYAKRFYSDNLTEEEIFNNVRDARIKLGKKVGFNGLKMIQVIQKMTESDIYPNNKYIEINDKYLKKEDFFKEEIHADILVITNKYKNIPLCHRNADCPILIAEDRLLGVSAIVHCNMYHINRGLPKEFIKILINNYKSNPSNIYLYIGSCIHKESYIYDRYPTIATNTEIWKDAIKKEKDGYHIDLIKAIKNQLQEFNLAEIKISKNDTATTKNYASHSAEYRGDITKKGQNIVGFYYKDVK